MMNLRDYQQAAVDAVFEKWKEHRSCLVVLPTGCGKTIVFGEVIRRILQESGGEGAPRIELASRLATLGGYPAPCKGRIMVLAHREELIRQAADKIQKMTGIEPAIEMGPHQVEDMGLLTNPRIVVSSVQTQITGRIGKFPPEEFAAVIIDEAHHATSPSYRECIDHYLSNPNCKLLGVTATPDRADETALGNVFESVAFEYPVIQAVMEGWLVPVKQKLVKVDGLDYSGVKTTGGDLDQGELSIVLEEEKALHAIADPAIEICAKRRAIIFAVSVKQAERLCEILNRHVPEGEMLAGWVCGKTPKDERQRILGNFARGNIQFVVNVGVLTEGFDDAGVEVVVMARPTKSRALYAQMAGRATRPAAEIAADLGNHDVTERRALIAMSSKPHCLIVDFVGNSGRHKLVTTADILGGEDLKPDDEAVQIAKRRAEEAPDGVDMAEEIAKAREEIERRKMLDAAARRSIVLKAFYHERTIDPFDLFAGRTVLAPTETPRTVWRSLTGKQEFFLRKKGWNPDEHTPEDNRRMLDESFRRIARGLPTYRQTAFLAKHGFVLPMTYDEAQRTIDWIKRGRR